MVKALSQDLKMAISAALKEAEQRTTAEILVVVAPSSDHYQAQVQIYGLAFASFCCFELWFSKMLTGYPQLLLLQIALMSLVTFVPPLRALAVKLVPRRIHHHMAARRAHEEFLIALRHVPAGTPAVFLYVSLLERYVHILHSRDVPAKVPQEKWEAAVAEFVGLMKTTGLKPACIAAIATIARTLQPGFPRGA
jgi:putative membrane protein